MSKSRKKRRAAKMLAKNNNQSANIEKRSGDQRQIISASRTQVRREEFSGPIPPPDYLEQYGNIVEGGAERIFRMAENQSEHRMKIESNIVNADIRRSDFGLLYGFIIALVVTGSGTWITIRDRDVIGYIAMLTPLVSILGLFIYNRQSKSKEKKEGQSEKKKK